MKIWLWPILIGLLSGIALLVGLLFDDAWDEFATLMLGLPVLIASWFGGCRQRRATAQDK